jgi:CarboxypepD_reg-like domain/TonB-dependent Receptor Plug Domain
MKTLLFAILNLMIAFASFSQAIINGTITDAKTGEALPYANVYINNTTIGAQTDVQGKFVIQKVPLGNGQLVVSYVGYESYTQNINVEIDKIITLNIKLIPLGKILDDVQVKAKKDKDWERKLKRFTRVFFGERANSFKCEILNPWVIDFEIDSLTNAFKARSLQPIEIENKALGYKLYYDLKEFSESKTQIRLMGNTRFVEMEAKDAKEKKRWDAARQQTFELSSRNFFIACIHNQLDANGYSIYKIDMNEWRNTNVWAKTKAYEKPNFLLSNTNEFLQVTTVAGKYKLILTQPIEVIQSQKYVTVPSANVYNSNPVTRMRVLKPSVSITSEGLLDDPLGVEMLGFWGEERVSSLLPINYLPQSLRTGDIAPDQPPTQAAYISTSKNEYISGENVWGSAFVINNQNHHFWPSIQPLYVQLYAPAGNLMTEEVWFTQNGRGTGFLKTSLAWPSGVYRIRAFSRWMLNRTESIFEKNIVLLNPDDKEGILLPPTPPNNQILIDTLTITVKPSQQIYKPNQLITLDLSSFINKNPQASSLTVSVIDEGQTTHLPKAHLPQYIANLKDTPHSKELIYPLESNLSVKGFVRNKLKKKLMPNMRILWLWTTQGKNQTRLITSDKDGFFVLDNVDLDGELPLNYQVSNAKGQPDTNTEIVIEPMVAKRTLAPIESEKTPLKFPIAVINDGIIEKDTVAIPKNQDELAPVKDLSQVGINKIYNKPTYSVKFDSKSPRFNSITDMIIGQLPGVTMQSGGLLVRGISSFTSSTEPMILLDGMDIGSSLAGINPQDVVQIDLLSGAETSIYGVRGANGVIAIYTRRGLEKNDQSLAQTVIIKGYQPIKNFETPVYPTTNALKKADKRITVYWNPLVETNINGEASVSFYATDLPTRYRIIVEGMTSAGMVGSTQAVVEVK